MNLRPSSLAHGLMTALVALYGAVIVALSLRRAIALPLFLALAALFFAALMILARRCERFAFSILQTPDRLSLRVFFAASALCLLSMGLYLAGYYPGGFSSDTLIQWVQVHTPVFEDHHPALHTLMIYALTRIVDHPVFVLGVQLVCFALAVGYMAAVLYSWRFPRLIVALVTAYISLSPAVCNMMTFLWKDCAFAICVLVLAVQIMQTHFSRGRWLSRPSHIAALALTLCLASILRHNGPAMTLPAGVWLLISLRTEPASSFSSSAPSSDAQSRPDSFSPRKRVLCALLGAVALFGLIKGPLYTLAGVQPKQDTLDETFGVPMTVLTHIYAEAPESLDEETVAYLETIAPWQIYHDCDVPGDWNNVKWQLGFYDISEYTLPQISAFALRAALKHPQLAVEALSGLWQMPLLPFGEAWWKMSPYVDPDFYGYVRTGVPLIANALGMLGRGCSRECISWLVWNPGFPLLAVMLACVLFSRRRPLCALTLPAMLICYNLTTALVLSSSSDFRFFLSTPIIAPLALLMLCAQPREPANPRILPERSPS